MSLHPIGKYFNISNTAELLIKTLSFLINIIESTILASILGCLHSSIPISDCKEANLNLPTLSFFKIKLTEPLQRLQRPSKRIILR